MRSPAVASFALWSVVGCAAISRPHVSVARLEADAVSAAIVHRALLDSVIERLARRATLRGDRTLDLLLLSGGGQHGAYGAGFLRGWRARADTAMPRFDLVSGISAGALEAPFALIGTKPALDTLAALYERAAESIAPTFDRWFWLRRTGGLVNVTRYARTLEAVFDDSLRARLRREFATGRELLIGTTDMDLGIGRLWDLSRELDAAASGPGRAPLLLRASSAIPSVFPPVIVDGHVHSDGGVISNLVTVLDLADYRRLAAQFRRAGVTDTVTVRLWVIMNVFSYVTVGAVDPASRGKIGQRANGLGFLAKQPQIFEYLTVLARAVTADVPGLRMELHVTAVPTELLGQLGTSGLLNRDWIRRLLDVGYARAQSTTPWDSIVGPYVRQSPSWRQPHPARRSHSRSHGRAPH